MTIIEVDLKNASKVLYLVELLKSLDFVERVSVRVENEESPTGAQPLQTSVSGKYWGAWKKNPLSIEKIDFEIRKMRSEWDRDIY